MNFQNQTTNIHHQQTSVLNDKTNTQYFSTHSKIYSSSGGNLFTTVLQKTNNTPTKIHQMSPTTNLTPTSTNSKRTKVITNKFPSNAYLQNSTTTQGVTRYFSPNKQPTATFHNNSGNNGNYTHKFNINSGRKGNYQQNEKEVINGHLRFNSNNNNSFRDNNANLNQNENSSSSGFNLKFRSPQIISSNKKSNYGEEYSNVNVGGLTRALII